MTTAAVVIIGDEILKGTFKDDNGPYLTGRLRALGVSLRRLVVLPDELDVIADTVRRLSATVDHVFTTGGVGPTHDDITLDAIAAAFGVQTHAHPELLALMASYGLPEDAANRRMATVPVGAELVKVEGMLHPTIRMRNVWVFPGVPRILRQKFEALAPLLKGPMVSVARVYARNDEFQVAQRLSDLAKTLPEVDIGSYPRFGETDFKLIVTLESRDEVKLAAARDDLLSWLDVVRVE